MHVGLRLTFDDGVIVEMTHNPNVCHLKDPEEWVRRMISCTQKAKRERFESDVPLNRTVRPDGIVEDRLTK